MESNTTLSLLKVSIRSRNLVLTAMTYKYTYHINTNATKLIYFIELLKVLLEPVVQDFDLLFNRLVSLLSGIDPTSAS